MQDIAALVVRGVFKHYRQGKPHLFVSVSTLVFFSTDTNKKQPEDEGSSLHTASLGHSSRFFFVWSKRTPM